MTVYVDNMRARVGRLILCHMIADSEDELHKMASLIGVARRWYQDDHYDICLAKRAIAVSAGAHEVTYRQLGCMVANRRETGSLGNPACAVDLRRGLRRSRSIVAPLQHLPDITGCDDRRPTSIVTLAGDRATALPEGARSHLSPES